MDGAALAAFVLASIVLAVTPGPGVVYIVTCTLAQGRAAGFASVAGVALGNLLNAAGAALGLAALLAVSRWAFTLLQVAGALYLFWLALRVLRAPSQASAAGIAGIATPADKPWALFRHGALVALLNPKTALFFAAFLPQFIDARLPALPQALALAALFVLIAACSDALYVAAAARLAPWLAGRRNARGGPPGDARSFARLATAAVYITLGLGGLYAGWRQPR